MGGHRALRPTTHPTAIPRGGNRRDVRGGGERPAKLLPPRTLVLLPAWAFLALAVGRSGLPLDASFSPCNPAHGDCTAAHWVERYSALVQC